MQTTLYLEREMFDFGRKLAESLSGGETILLSGEMGAGKTVLAKGIAEGLGVKEPVVSPTFSLVHEYAGRLRMYHYDLFRIRSEIEAEEAGLTERLGEAGSVSVIEWPEMFPQVRTGKVIKIKIEIIDENTRLVSADGLK